WISDFVPTSLFAMKFRTLAFGPLGTLPSTPRRTGMCVSPDDIEHHCHELIGSPRPSWGTDALRANAHFRYSPDGGLINAPRKSTQRATRRLMHRSKVHSITLVDRANIIGGI